MLDGRHSSLQQVVEMQLQQPENGSCLTRSATVVEQLSPDLFFTALLS